MILHGKINQNGRISRENKLEAFKSALKLQGTPELYAQDKPEGKTSFVKFFDPTGSWTWYAMEWDGNDECFGLVKGFETELGYFSLSELASIKGQLGIGIEVDEFFEPQEIKA